ncbi:MAG: glycerol-3-phosphate acyltransferase [Oscillospiraceae bacterium]|nr:glycerol-3-phosphate acyltransferase [Oscillospiraceae bacterium]
MAYILGALIGYLFGCINMANIISKSRGINIKKVGSNNAGASNVFISVGKAYGVAVGAFDILKAFCAAELVYILFSNNLMAGVIAGSMAVMGHIFPFWMNFNGGKGLAPFMGLVLFYDWKVFLAFVAVIIVLTLVTDFIAVGALTVTALMPFYAIIIKNEYWIASVFIIVAAVMWYKHRENIGRMKEGTEIGFLRKNKVRK